MSYKNIIMYILLFAAIIKVMICDKKTDKNKMALGSIMGSYTMEVISIEVCDLPKSAYHPNINVSYYVQPYRINRKTQRLRANFTLYEDVPNISGSAISRNWKDSGYTKIFEFHDMDCHHYIMQTLTKVMKMSVNAKCTVAAGVYTFDNLDINSLLHLVVSVYRYGRYSIDMKWHNPEGVIACVRIIVMARPDKNSS